MLSVSYAGKNTYSAGKTSGVLRGGPSGANRCYVLAHCASPLKDISLNFLSIMKIDYSDRIFSLLLFLVHKKFDHWVLMIFQSRLLSVRLQPSPNLPTSQIKLQSDLRLQCLLLGLQIWDLI